MFLTKAQRQDRAVEADAGFRPLNPSLYSQLKKVFGKPRVSHQGIRFRFTDLDSSNGQRKRIYITQAGEHYHISCPFCSDTRYRLSVSYMYRQELSGYRRAYFLANCFNATHCLEDEDNRREFEALLDKGRPQLIDDASVRRGVDYSSELKAPRMPGSCVLLNSLSPDHPSRMYVADERFLDPDRLSRVWGVSVCEDIDVYEHRFLVGYIIVPVWFRGKFVGWQGRYPAASTPTKRWPPKYFTMPGLPKTNILGNYDHAAKFRSVVLVEGWFDVFGGAGPHGVLVFGSSISDTQMRLLRSTWTEGQIIYALDPDLLTKPDSKERTERMLVQLKIAFPGRFVHVRLPADEDPGSLSRSAFRAIAESEARKSGITIDWRLK